MLIVCDDSREGVENIVEFVQRHSGLHFNLALVEAALYRDVDWVALQALLTTRSGVNIFPGQQEIFN